MRRLLFACASIALIGLVACEDIVGPGGDPVDLSYAPCAGATDNPTWFAFQDGDGTWQRVNTSTPSDLYSEVVQKTNQYLRYGTRAVVVVDPGKRIVQVHRSSSAGTITATIENVLDVDDVVPGWKLPLDDLFSA